MRKIKVTKKYDHHIRNKGTQHILSPLHRSSSKDRRTPKLTHGIELNSRKSFLRKSVRDMGTVAYLKDEKCVLNVLPYPESFWTKEQVFFYPKTINTCIYKEFRGEKVFIKA